MNCVQKVLKSNFIFFRLTVILFKVLGLAPFSYAIFSSTRNQKKEMSSPVCYSIAGMIYSIILLVFIFCSLIFCIIIAPPEIVSDRMTTSLLFIIIAGAHSVLITIIIIYCVKQKIAVQILNELINFYYEMTETFHGTCKRKSQIYSLFIVLVHILILTSLFSGNKWFIQHPYQITVKINLILILGFSIGSVIIQYALVIIFLHKILSDLNRTLSKLINNDKQYPKDLIFLTQSSHKNVVMKDLILLRESQRRLYEISCEVSRFYSEPILCAITLLFIWATYSSYHLINSLLAPDCRDDSIPFIYTVLWILKDAFPILILTNCVTRFKTEMRRTGDIINEIMVMHPVEGEVKFELEYFSIELLHRDVPFTACGLFSLDGNLLTSIVSTTVTYMAILVEFESKIKDGGNCQQVRIQRMFVSIIIMAVEYYFTVKQII